MLCGCFIALQGPKPRKPPVKCLAGFRNLCRNFQWRRLWPLGKRNPQTSTPEAWEELSDGFSDDLSDDLSLYEVQEHQATDTLHSHTQSSTPEIQELADGFTYAISRYKVQPSLATYIVQSCTQSFHQDILEELFKGPGYSIYRVRVQVHQVPDTVPSWSEILRRPGSMTLVPQGNLQDNDLKELLTSAEDPL